MSNHFRNVWSRIIRQPRVTTQLKKRRPLNLVIDQLEDRLTPAGTTSISLDALGNLLVADSTPGGHNDNLTFSKNGANLQIADGSGAILNVTGTVTGASGTGTSTVTVPLTTVTGGVLVTGLGGVDTFTYSNSGGLIGRAITISGSDPTTAGASESIVLQGSTAVTNAAFYFNNATSGSVVLDGTDTINYTNRDAAPIVSSLTATNITLNYSSSTAKTINVRQAPSDATKTQFDSTLGASVAIKSPSGVLTINANGVNGTVTGNIININSLGVTSGAFLPSLTVQATPTSGTGVTINENASFTMASGKNLTFNAAAVNLTKFAQIALAGTGSANLTSAGAILADYGSSLTVVNGNLNSTSATGTTITGATFETTGTGNIAVSASSGLTISNGGRVISSSLLSNGTAGRIRLNSTTGTASVPSLLITDSSSAVTSGYGDILITATSTANATNSWGFVLQNNGALLSTGTGQYAAKITVSASGGTSTTNYGVYMGRNSVTAAGGVVTTVDGDVSVTGSARNSSNANQFGIYMEGATQITSTGKGNISLNGEANGTAIYFGNAPASQVVSSGSGNITVKGMSSGANAGVSMTADAAGIISKGTGNVTILANQLNTSGNTMSIDAGSNTLTLAPAGAFTAGIANTLTLGTYPTNAQLSRMRAGTITIGNSDTGAITVNDTVTLPKGSNLNLVSSSTITFNAGKFVNASGGDVSLTSVGAITTSNTTVSDITARSLTVNAGASNATLRAYVNAYTNAGSGSLTVTNLNTSGAAPIVQLAGSSTITSGVTLGSSNSVLLNANSTSSYDQIQVNSGGALNLNNATLKMTVDFLANGGDTLTIIKNNGGTITGAFAGGSSYFFNGQKFNINYNGGGDVVLTKDNSFSPPTVTVTGTIAAALASVTADGTVVNVPAGIYPEAVNLDLTPTQYSIVLNFQGTSTINSLSGGLNDLVAFTGGLNIGDANTTPVTTYAAIAGDTGLSKAGTGTQVFAGNTNYTGGTSISNGTLQIGDGIYSGSLQGDVSISASGAGLTFATASYGLKYTGAITTAAGAIVTKAGPGTLMLTGANAYTTSTTISAGTLQIGDAVTTTTAFAGPIANAAALAFAAAPATTLTYNGLITLAGPLTISNASTGVVNLGGANTAFYGATNINSGTLQLGNASALGAATAGGVTVASGAKLQLNSLSASIGSLSGSGTVENGSTGTSTLTVGSNISSTTFSGLLQDGTGGGNLALTKAQALTRFTLTGVNTYTGPTTVSAGYLIIGADNNVGSGNIVLSGGILRANSTFTLSASRTIVAGGTIEVIKGNTLTIASTIINNGVTATALTVGAGGTVVLTGTGSHTGGTAVNGMLQIGPGGSLSSTGTLTVNSVLSFNPDSNGLIHGGTIAGAGAIYQVGSGTTTLKGTNTFSGTTVISSGILQIGDGTAATPTLGGTILDNANLAFNLSGTTGASAANISGNGSVTVSGSGTVTLSGTNTYLGATTVSAGVLQANSVAAFSPNSAFSVANLATLRLNGKNNSIGSLTGAGTVDNTNTTPATLTIGTNNTSPAAFSGILADGVGAGALSVTKTGSGTLTVSGTSNTYIGATAVNGGVLAVTGSITTSAITEAAGVSVVGSGTTGATTISGNLTPGTSSTIGILTTGNLTYLNASTGSTKTLNIRMSGATTPGTDYDQLVINVGSSVNLAGATLNIAFTNGFTPTVGQSFTILANNGVTVLTGVDANIFNGLPQNSIFTTGGTNFKVTYSAGAVVLTAVAATTPVTLTSTQNPIVGTSVTLTATVGGTNPTGDVTFYDNGTVLGTGTISGGIASLNTFLSLGQHSLIAAFADDGVNPAGTSAPFVQTIRPTSQPTVAVTASPASPPVYGTAVTFTATLTGGSTPTGIVQFFDGTTSLGTGLISGASATFASITLAGGAHNITAVYLGDANNNPSAVSSALAYTVTQATTTVAVTADPLTTASGQTFQFAALVSSSVTNGVAPTGTVDFYTDAGGVTPVNPTPIAVNSKGVATFTVSSLTGITSLTAVYSGDANYAGNSLGSYGISAITCSATNGGTVTVTTSANHSFVTGQLVTISGVTPNVYNGTFAITNTGATTFTYSVAATAPVSTYTDGTAFGTASTALSIDASQAYGRETVANASFENPALAANTDNVNGNQFISNWIVANATPWNSGSVPKAGIFNQTAPVVTGSQTLRIFVQGASTAVPVTVTSAAPVALVQDNTIYRFQIDMAAAGGTFSTAGNRAEQTQVRILARGVVVAAADIPELLTNSFNPITLSVTWNSGTANTGDPLTLQISDNTYSNIAMPVRVDFDNVRFSALAASQTVVSSTPNPAAPSQSVTLTATITAVGGSATPSSGTVTFYDGSTILGTGSVGIGGTATLVTTQFVSGGNHSVTAIYSGDNATFGGSTSAAYTQVVAATPSVTSLSPNFGPAAGGTTITINGANFSGSPTVLFGATPGTSVTVLSSSQITAVSPVGSGAVHVTVTTPAGTSSTSGADLYTYIAAPTVASVTPFIGPTSGGNTVIITGTNFKFGANVLVSGATGVQFGGGNNATSYVVNSASQITATAPSGSSTVDVIVTNIYSAASTAAVADHYTYATPSVTSVQVNGGAIVAKNVYGNTPVLAGQQSIVEQLLVTFNERVLLDANAFNISSLAGIVTASVAIPSTAAVAVNSAAVTSTGNATDGYTQYVLTFAAGAGVNSFTNANPGNSFTLIKDGVWQLNVVGSKVHAGVSDTAADAIATKFWSLYSAVNPQDVTASTPIGNGNSKLLSDGVALGEMYQTFGSFQNVAGPPAYNTAYDSNLDGIVDGIDLGKMYANFGTIWQF